MSSDVSKNKGFQTQVLSERKKFKATCAPITVAQSFLHRKVPFRDFQKPKPIVLFQAFLKYLNLTGRIELVLYIT